MSMLNRVLRALLRLVPPVALAKAVSDLQADPDWRRRRLASDPQFAERALAYSSIDESVAPAVSP